MLFCCMGQNTSDELDGRSFVLNATCFAQDGLRDQQILMDCWANSIRAQWPLDVHRLPISSCRPHPFAPLLTPLLGSFSHCRDMPTLHKVTVKFYSSCNNFMALWTEPQGIGSIYSVVLNTIFQKENACQICLV